jgi:hypothetical protein
VSTKGATRRPARGYPPEKAPRLGMMMETLDFAAKVSKNRRRNKLARAARKRNRK